MGRRVLLTEGGGDDDFFGAIKGEFGLQFEIIEREENTPAGDGAFKVRLDALIAESGVAETELVILVADCDAAPKKKFANVCKQIRMAEDYAVPAKSGVRAKSSRKIDTAVLMIPEPGRKGSLETLCFDLASRKRPEIAKHVEEFTEHVTDSDWEPQKISKLQYRCVISASCPTNPLIPLSKVWERSDPLVPLTLDNKQLAAIVKILREL